MFKDDVVPLEGGMMSGNNETVRNGIILYGFFFVLLSGLLSVAARPDLHQATEFYLFILAIIMSNCSVWIGLGILREASSFNLFLKLGLLGLSLAVPLGYLLVVVSLLSLDLTLVYVAILMFGIISFIVPVVFVRGTIIDKLKERKQRKAMRNAPSVNK
ncbi:MAG: hypothetical protein ACXACI_17520 [Candidatus Hodarchaeales archaeon]|jgi:hypothetical protein